MHTLGGRFTAGTITSAFKLYGTNDPDAKWSTLPLLDSSTGSDGKEYLDSGDTPYRYFIWWGNDQGDGTNAAGISSFGLIYFWAISPATLLSLAMCTNPDLQYFQVGDMVQGDQLPTQIHQKV